MSWSKTDTGIHAGHKEHFSTPTNFSGTDAVAVLEREQWRVAMDCAQRIINSKAVGTSQSSTATYTVSVSGTAAAGHPNNDTITVTVTAIAQ